MQKFYTMKYLNSLYSFENVEKVLLLHKNFSFPFIKDEKAKESQNRTHERIIYQTQNNTLQNYSRRTMSHFLTIHMLKNEFVGRKVFYLLEVIEMSSRAAVCRVHP